MSPRRALGPRGPGLAAAIVLVVAVLLLSMAGAVVVGLAAVM